MKIKSSIVVFLICPKPHARKMGVYVFIYGDQFLKIGKAGPMSKARFLSHHYNPHSSRSNLAGINPNGHGDGSLGITEDTVGSWIKTNCRHELF